MLRQHPGVAHVAEEWRLGGFTYRRNLHQSLEYAYSMAGRHGICQTGQRATPLLFTHQGGIKPCLE